MGRKIPAKKHRGVKNPLEQQARRENSLKCKINAPPRDPDDQPVPRSLTRLFAFQDKSNTSNRHINKKKMLYNKNDNKSDVRKNPVLSLKRLAGESGRSFSLRINGAVRALHEAHSTDTATLSHHYLQDMEAEDVKGERMAAQRERRRRRRGRQGADPPTRPTRPAQTGDQVRQERSCAEVRYERVPFGEVAHAPPVLAARAATRTTRPDTSSRPGRRELLLTALLAGAGAGAGAGDLH